MSDDQNTNSEDDVMARIDELDNTMEGTALEGFTKDISETLREKYGPGSMSDEPYQFDGAMADMDGEIPFKFMESVTEKNVMAALATVFVAVELLWGARSIVKIAKDLRS